MKYAVIKISGSQFKVCEGDEIEVSRLSDKEGDKIEFNEVLLAAADNKLKLGKPVVKDAKVSGMVLKHMLGEKVHISKFKAKTGYRRKIGFRPKLSLVKIEKIEA
jgi:large subunit ribosomal protein L21